MAIAELPKPIVVRIAKALVTSNLLVMEITPAKTGLAVASLDIAALALTVSVLERTVHARTTNIFRKRLQL